LGHLRGKFSIVEGHVGFIINTNQENIHAKMEGDEEGRDAKENTAIQERIGTGIYTRKTKKKQEFKLNK
jgi:hypothetical protein